MTLKYKCPKCGTVWQVGPNIEKVIRDLRKQNLDINLIAMTGERKCSGCGRVMTIKEVAVGAYEG